MVIMMSAKWHDVKMMYLAHWFQAEEVTNSVLVLSRGRLLWNLSQKVKEGELLGDVVEINSASESRHTLKCVIYLAQQIACISVYSVNI